MNESTDELATLNKDGTPPTTRLKDAKAVEAIVAKLIEADLTRDAVRARVKGLVDGNPPFSAKRLREAGQSDRTNVNFREAEGFLTMALSSFYDVFSEVPQFATIQGKEGGTDEEIEQWNKQATCYFDELQKADRGFDFLKQQSQHDMVLYGTGPVFWGDTMDWRAKAVRSSRLKVLDRTPASVDEWTLAAVFCEYAPDQLYGFIKDAEAATAVGWDVAATRKAIMGANVNIDSPGDKNGWEWHQQQLRNNDLYYSAMAATVNVAHVFFKEFSGKITHVIVLDKQVSGSGSFLFRKIGRFDNWRQIVCPFYYDMGDGQHHSVKGMGIKFYSTLEIKNRLKCATVDSAFARSQILLSPQTAGDAQKLSVAKMGPYAILPPNVNAVQQNVAGVMDGPMEMERELENVLQTNLSQYRQRIDKPQGNPRTAFEVGAILNQASSLGKTQLNRYYEQLDDFYSERHRRAINKDLVGSNKEKDQPEVNPGADLALEYQKKCKDAGIPRRFLETACVHATRSTGQGSAYLKQQVLKSLLELLPLLPESGRTAVIQDFIAAMAGQRMVTRYFPTAAPSPKEEDQFALAALEHAALRQSAPAVVTSTQIHSIHALAHMNAGVDALNSVPEGGDPAAVLAFIGALLNHVQEHINILASDKTREKLTKALTSQFKNLQKLAAELQSALEKQQKESQAQQQAQAKAQQQVSEDGQIKAQSAMMESQRKDAQVAAEIARKDAKAKQDMAIADAQAAREMLAASKESNNE